MGAGGSGSAVYRGWQAWVGSKRERGREDGGIWSRYLGVTVSFVVIARCGLSLDHAAKYRARRVKQQCFTNEKDEGRIRRRRKSRKE